MPASLQKYVTAERAMLGFFVGVSFVGIWHALPMLNVIADEMYFVGGVFRAMEAKSLLPLAGDVPYGTITFYLNYLLEIPILAVLLVWKGFHLTALKQFLILNSPWFYLVPRFLSACIASLIAYGYNRFLREEGVVLGQRFAALAALFLTILPGVIFHTGKMWVLSIALVFASLLLLYRALAQKNVRAARWSVLASFLAFANFPLAGIFLINIPILAYAFWGDARARASLARATMLGALAAVFITTLNYRNILAQVLQIFTQYHPIIASVGLPHSPVLPLPASFLLHSEQVLAAYLPVLILIVLVALVAGIRNRLLFFLSLGYAALYFITLVFLATWYAHVGDYLRYLFPLAFFFSAMVASLNYRKMALVFTFFSIVQAGIGIYVLYLLAIPTTYNVADYFVLKNFSNQPVVIINTVTALDLPLNSTSALGLKDQYCGTTCEYARTASTTNFMPLVATPQTDQVKLMAELRQLPAAAVFWIGDHPFAGACGAKLQNIFSGGASDLQYAAVEENLGDYLLPDFWHLSRLGENMYLYQISRTCLADPGFYSG